MRVDEHNKLTARRGFELVSVGLHENLTKDGTLHLLKVQLVPVPHVSCVKGSTASSLVQLGIEFYMSMMLYALFSC